MATRINYATAASNATVTQFPTTANVSVDILAMEAAMRYLQENYGSNVRLDSITSFQDGSVRIAFVAYVLTGRGESEWISHSVFGNGRGEAGE